jgi:thiamine pyrophosphate-dependent acetolactate synthase large subunit-like protein
MYLSVPDDDGFCFTQAYQSIGLGLATAIGAALAHPTGAHCRARRRRRTDEHCRTGLRQPCASGVPLVVVVYNDEAYGAGSTTSVGQAPALHCDLPETDIAAIGRGFGV